MNAVSNIVRIHIIIIIIIIELSSASSFKHNTIILL